MDSHDLPEINSFGTLVRFAIGLEHHALAFTEACAERTDLASRADLLSRLQRDHRRRSRRLERLKREQLNEVVLEPISGMERDRYLPPALPTPDRDASQVIQDLAALEQNTARFYADSADHARGALSGLARTFRKMGDRSARFAEECA